MSTDKKNSLQLRKKAEILLEQRGITDHSHYTKDLESLVEELSIYQIELEHQNEELVRAQDELELLKNRYADLFNTAPIGYFLIRKDYQILDVNTTGCNLLNQDYGKLKKQKISQYIQVEYQDTFYFHLRQTLLQKQPQSCDVKMRHSNNKEFFARLISVQDPRLGTDEMPVIRTSIIDIDNEKRMEINLLKEKEKAEVSDKLKSAFLANMSHEIRTPMNSILGYSELLSDKDITEEERTRFSSIISNSSNQLMQLINDIIDISKLEAHQLKVFMSDCNLNEICRNCYYSFINSELLKTKPNVKLILNLPDKYATVKTVSDPNRLQQVIMNLINNAIKFTENGAIEFGYELIDENEVPKLKFFVKDSGIGIPPEKFDLIFERFRQATDDGSHKGTGLGLSISKGIIELLNGNIGVESTPGKGATFSFIIPYTEPKDVVKTSEHHNLQLDLANKLIVIAEDDPYSYLYVKQILKSAKAELVHVNDGLQLMDLLEKRIPDLILLDINMPIKNGYDCLREIRLMRIQTKIIVQTAYAMSDERERIMHAGADSYISKPIRRAELFQVIEQVLQGDVQ
ncbi:MAG: response regulator [Bacteroidales bacterium]|nr:response regulator [Bacteroidales bacterium]